MKKIMMILVTLLAGLTTYAQELNADSLTAVMRYGFLSYDSVMVAMPEYAEMTTSMAELRKQYEAEQKRVEDDFNKKYEEFLDGQATYPKTILQKRQSELQEILDKNIAFKKESQLLLDNAEKKLTTEIINMIDQIINMIDQAVSSVAQENKLAFVLNMDKGAVTYVNPAQGIDITEAVKKTVTNKQETITNNQ